MQRPSIDQQITFLYTHSIEKTAAFYETIMQFPLVIDQGLCRVYAVAGDAYVGFCERESAPDQPQGILFTLVTDEVDAWYAHLTAHDVPTDGQPRLNPEYGIYHFFADDPNGYKIEVQKFNDANWHEQNA